MGDFKIGVIADCFRTDIKEGIKKAASLGADGVQLYAGRGELDVDNMTGEKLRELNDVITSCGLVVSALCGDLGGHGFQVRADNPAKIDKSKRIMDMALELNTNVVTTHIGVVPDEMIERRQIMAEACEDIGSYGDSIGVRFAIETGPEPAETLKGFLDSLSTKSVCVNFDPANLAMVIGEDTTQSALTLGDYIVHTHAKDGIMLQKTSSERIYGIGTNEEKIIHSEYYREVPLGQGSVNFDTYLAALVKIGYQGFLTIEREVGDKPEEDIAMAVGFLKEKINRL